MRHEITDVELLIHNRNCKMRITYSIRSDYIVRFERINMYFDENKLAFFVLNKTDQISSKYNDFSLKYNVENDQLIIINNLTDDTIIIYEGDIFFKRIKNCMNSYYKKIFDVDGILPDSPRMRF